MKIQCVVIKRATALYMLHRWHCVLFHTRKVTKDSIILADGTPVIYLTPGQFEKWKYGQTYIFLEHYITGNECFYHSEHRISREDLAKLLNEGGEKI